MYMTNNFQIVMRIFKMLTLYLDYVFSPFTKRIRQIWNRKKYVNNSFAKSFTINWSDINFNRIAVVNLILNSYNKPKYLEIGCASNALFNSIPIIDKTGVDPVLGGNIRLTSDEFFEKNDNKFDVIFIDGLHTYEQVRKDVINSFKFLNKTGVLVLHDMFPLNWIESHVPNISNGAWTGDVWKIAFELIETPGIEFRLLKIDHGVGVVKLLKTEVNLSDLTARLTNEKFSFFYSNIKNLPVYEYKDSIEWLKDHSI